MNNDVQPSIDADMNSIIEDKESTILDLQMTIVAMQTEQEIAIQNKEKESQNQIRSLQEQLRRLQNETNILRSRNHYHQSKKQQSPSRFSNFEKSIPSSLNSTSTAVTNCADAPLNVEHSPMKHVPTVTNNDALLQPQYNQLQIQSPGQRLIQQLLLFYQPKNRSMLSAFEQDVERALGQLLSSSSLSSTSVLSEWDIIQWLIIEVMHVAPFPTKDAFIEPSRLDSSSGTCLQSVREPFVSSSASLSRQEHFIRIQILLQWLFDALSLSSSSCNFFCRCAVKANSINGLEHRPCQVVATAVTPNQPSLVHDKTSFERQANTFSDCHSSSRPFRMIKRHFSRPLFSASSTQLIQDVKSDDSEEPSSVQCWYIRCFMQFLQTLCNFKGTEPLSSAEVLVVDLGNPALRLCMELSIQSMQMATLLSVSGSVHFGEADCFFWDACAMDTILADMISIGTVLLIHFSGASPECRLYNDVNNGPSLRLAHVEYLQLQEQKVSFTLSENDSKCSEGELGFCYMKWLTEATEFLHLVIWNKSSCISPCSSFEQLWIDTKRTTSFVSILLDLLQHVILPDAKRYSHPFTKASISFLHSLIRTQNKEDEGRGHIDNHGLESKRSSFYWSLLLCRHVTDRSSEELWCTAPTAIDVLVRLLHQIVLRQLVDDHIPNASSNTLLVVSLSPVRDQIVRFLHRALLYVQNDRRWWEIERAKKDDQNKEKKYKMPLSFTAILSDNVEIYKSAVGALLSISPSDDCIQVCTPSPNIRSMLKLQVNELAEDATEELQN